MLLTINFQDVFKKSVLSLFPSTIDPTTLILTLIMALIIGLGIFMVYKRYFIGVVYDHSFNLSLVIMCVLVAVIIVTISSNITLSLGMVGALSIVRYRTAVKNSLDLMFMFWAITSGIAVGAQFYYIGIIAFIFVTLTFAILSKLKGSILTYIVVIKYENDLNTEEEIRRIIQANKGKIRSKMVTKDSVELTSEMSLAIDNLSITNQFSKIEKVKDVTLVQYRSSYEI